MKTVLDPDNPGDLGTVIAETARGFNTTLVAIVRLAQNVIDTQTDRDVAWNWGQVRRYALESQTQILELIGACVIVSGQPPPKAFPVAIPPTEEAMNQ